MSAAWRWMGFACCGLVLALIFGDAADLGAEDGCSVSELVNLLSPDGDWRAVLDQSVCYGGGFAASVGADVRVVSTHDPAKTADLLDVDTGGSDLQRPRIAWVGPTTLRVTVQNLAFLTVGTRSFGPVQVDLRFDPPDPAARARWLRELDARDSGG